MPSQLVGIEERTFELGPESLRTAAGGRRADDAGIRAPSREQALDVVARHQDVAVRHHDPVVRGPAPTLADVVELRVVADRLVADEEPRGNMRMRRDQLPHERHGGVVGARRAEDDLIARIARWKAERSVSSMWFSMPQTGRTRLTPAASDGASVQSRARVARRPVRRR